MAAYGLPAQSTPFIGRTRELAQIANLLSHPACRLLTLVGPGGIGKTRLVLEAAQQQIPHFAQGVYFISLAALNTPEVLVSLAANAVGVSVFPGGDTKQQLLNFLQSKQVLLVFDSSERLLEDTGLITQLLQVASRSKVMVTSRERLNLLEETVFQVEGMDYPAHETTSDAVKYSAVQLFVDNARRLQPDLGIDDATLHSITRICRQVQGMPLALVLAAAWVNSLTLHEIAEEIARGFDFLQAETRNLRERHRHIRTVFDSSWAMLSKGERAAFRSMSVFRGSFTREAAQEVAGASVHVLASLVNKSMIRHDLTAGRYDVHELLRQYAAEKLDALPQESRAAHERHATYFAALMGRQSPRFGTRDQRAALDAIDQEMPNVTIAWTYAVQVCNEDAIRSMENSLSNYLDLRYRFQEAADLFGNAVSEARRVPRTPARDALLGRLMARHAWFLNAVGNPEQGRRVVQESLALLRPMGKTEDLLVALSSLSIIAFFLNQMADRKLAGEEGLRIARELDQPAWIGGFLYWLGLWAIQNGDYDDAKRFGEDALVIAEAAADPGGIATISSWVLSRAALALGHLEDARQLAERAEALFEEAGYFWGTATNYGQLGDIATAQREYATARRYYRQQLAMFAKAGGATPQTLETLGHFSRLFIAQGQTEKAVELLAFSLAHPTSYPLYRDDARNLLDQLESALPWRVFEAACQRGEALDFDRILADLLDPAAEFSSRPGMNQALVEPLSEREIDVLRLIAEGLSNAEIAQRLYLTVGTVKVHANHIFGKLGVRNRTEAAAHARRLNLM
mgnify:CR=1 FL=1